ncbi:MAG: hypothetical protein KF865_12170 [Bdellovibrionaceae bacterium]|nr:hypothetical protein [Pseudobdellovibrionaceae bacterium]
MPRRFSFAFFGAALSLVALSSCSPVRFSAQENSDKPGGGVTPQGGTINCDPKMNGSATSLTLTSTSANPNLAANCDPSNVTYNWTVTRDNAPVTINGLGGATSTPDFLGAGAGTYFISLDATSIGWTSYQLNTPLQVTVQGGGGGLPNIACNPKINGDKTTVTLAGANPTIAGNCVPPGVSYVWTVRRGGVTVSIPGMSGSSATPDFLSAGPGTYEVWLTANQSGYNAYTATSPLTVIVPNGGGNTGTPVSSTHNITVSNNKLDILLVVDDSKSMLADNRRLASRLEGFVNDLSAQGFDWQMCATLTRAQQISEGSAYYWGASYNWSNNPLNPQYILKSGTPDIYGIFTRTIENIGAGWEGTDDERAIKASWWHLWNGEPGVDGSSGCYRKEAGLAVIILSDEDERSIGGDNTQAAYESEKNKPLESDDLPQTYVNYVRQIFGAEKRFSVNSIIVRPGDALCKQKQDAEGTASHYGVKYAELSNLTNGYIGSICESDYSANLRYFKDAIVRSQASLPLQCPNPVGGTVNVTVNPPYAYTTSIDNGRLVFNPQIPAGSTVKLEYTCP